MARLALWERLEFGESGGSRGSAVSGPSTDFRGHEQCRVVITCRKAVYKGEFANQVNRTLEVVEFSDQQILTFLRTWEPSTGQRAVA